MLYQYFKEVQRKRKIKNKDLAAAIGISEKHFSRFGTGEANLSIQRFFDLLQALDRLSPGAKRDFAVLLADGELLSDKDSCRHSIAIADLEELQILTIDISSRLGELNDKYKKRK